MFGSADGEWNLAAVWKFLAAAGLTIVVSMVALTFVISEKMKTSTLQSVAEEGATLISSVLGPAVQGLANSSSLPPETIAILDRMVREQLSGRVVSIKIWLRDGTLVYATDKKLVGQKFPSSELDATFAGGVSASFDDMEHIENQFDRLHKTPLFEVYAPLYRFGSRDVIAVGEIYRNGERLASALKTVHMASAGIVGAITLPMMFFLFMIVRQANASVNLHQAALVRKMHEARELASLNDRLRLNAVEARLEAGRSNEQLLAQIGQDLHDGPIQLLSLLMMKLKEPDDGNASQHEAAASADPHSLTSRILREVRDISTGLVLPQLDGMTSSEVISLAVRQHEYSTGAKVACDVDALPGELPQEVIICLYRVIQEGLNNGFRHAGGRDQSLTCTVEDSSIRVVLSDSGPTEGHTSTETRGPRPGMGLPGLRRRVEAIGGSFCVSARPGGGTTVTAILPTAPMPDAGPEPGEKYS